MSSLKRDVETQLKEHPLARERKNKYRLFAKLLKANYWDVLQDVSEQTLMDIAADAISYNRWWQKLLQDNPEYRGSDYDEKKKVLEQQTQQNLGYTPGYRIDVKKLQKVYAED
jgi:hypothetical protein